MLGRGATSPPSRSTCAEKGRGFMRVLIVDEERLFGDVIRSILVSSGMDVLDVVHTVAAGTDAALRLRPQVVLLELLLPDGDGLAAGRIILESAPETKIIALTSVSDPEMIARALRGGFSGYITKDTPLSRFVSLIEAAARGEVVIPRRTAAAVTQARSEEDRHAVFLGEQLSRREREILTLLVDGSSSGEIARKLSVSPNTVRTHVQSILTKLQVHSRLEAATFAVRHSLVPVPGRNNGNGNGKPATQRTVM